MNGVISNEFEMKQLASLANSWMQDCDTIAKTAYLMADAMLKVRDK